jgi:hypothetical protein
MNFAEKKEYIKRNKKIELRHFDSVKEVLNLVDLLNNEVTQKADKRAEEDIHSISEFLARMEQRKIFILKKGK